MKPVIIIAIAFVLLIPIPVFAQEESEMLDATIDTPPDAPTNLTATPGDGENEAPLKQVTQGNEPIWILAIVSMFTGIATALYFAINLKRQKREIKRQALLERFNEFNSVDSKRGREVIAHAKYTEDGDYDGVLEDYRVFRRELGVLDTTANLVKNGDIHKERFLDLLSHVIIITYERAEPYIKFKQKGRGQHYASDFDWLYEEAKRWWKKNRPDDPWPKLDEYGD